MTASSRHADYHGFFYSQRCGFSGANVTFADGHSEWIPPGIAPNLLSKDLKIGGFGDVAQLVARAAIYCPPGWYEESHINWTNCFALLVWLVSVGVLLLRAVQNRRPLAMENASERAGEQIADQHVERKE